MIELTASGDKYFTTKLDSNRSHDDNHRLLSKLNIPIHCFYNQQIRQHYLDEYTAKYSKAKHLLSNARRKQRKIIITYYEEKEKQDDINRLQMVKESLLEENEKIKRFKEALKEKLIIYQQRIQFLQNTELWSALETQQLQNDIPNRQRSIDYFSSPSDSPTKDDSSHLLHDHKYSNNHLDDSCPTISDEYHFERSPEEFVSEIDENIENSISKENSKGYRFKILSTILIIGFAVLIVIFMNELLEQFLIYLTKPSRSISTISPSNSMIKSFVTYLLSTIYNYTTSCRIFEYSTS